MPTFCVVIMSEIHHGWQNAEVKIEADSKEAAENQAMAMLENGEIFFTVDEVDEACVTGVEVNQIEEDVT
jgi:hypothetical protein